MKTENIKEIIDYEEKYRTIFKDEKREPKVNSDFRFDDLSQGVAQNKKKYFVASCTAFLKDLTNK